MSPIHLRSAFLLGPLVLCTAIAQPVVAPWGNILGLEIDGQRFSFETALRAVNPDWSGFVQSSQYNWEGKPTFTRDGATHTCGHFLQGTQLDYTTRITETGRGAARIELEVAARAPLATAGTFFCMNVPAADHAGATFELVGAAAQPLAVLPDASGQGRELLRTRARGFRVASGGRTLEVVADAATEIILRQDFVDNPPYLNDATPRLTFVPRDPQLKVADYQVYFAVLPASAPAGTSARTAYTVRADGPVDRTPVELVLDAGSPGRVFDGIGGNFRMQYPELDAQVVDYMFAHLDVAWGRIAFPWAEWQPEEAAHCGAKVLAGGMSPSFYAQLAIARELARRRIPIIASVWVPPDWAVDRSAKLPKGVRLDPAKLQRSADSIADWLVFLKNHYGVEVALFSFNETDYGVEVKQTPEEHAAANRIIGATFAARGLVTKMVLGDTGACTLQSHALVGPSEADRSLLPSLGGVAFHNYHGLTPDALRAWAETARRTNLPLLCTEGGADSAAHRYPLIWATPWFAQLELDQYVRSGAACQPATIMPWQLNADYSLLAGGGIYGDHGPLRPTQRFWGLKQLGVLSHAFWLPITANRGDLSCAALGDIARGAYAVHIVNNAATRLATVLGLPAGVRRMRIHVTDATRGMQAMAVKGVVDGAVTFQLEAQAFTSLVSE